MALKWSNAEIIRSAQHLESDAVCWCCRSRPGNVDVGSVQDSDGGRCAVASDLRPSRASCAFAHRASRGRSLLGCSSLVAPCLRNSVLCALRASRPARVWHVQCAERMRSSKTPRPCIIMISIYTPYAIRRFLIFIFPLDLFVFVYSAPLARPYCISGRSPLATDHRPRPLADVGVGVALRSGGEVRARKDNEVCGAVRCPWPPHSAFPCRRRPADRSSLLRDTDPSARARSRHAGALPLNPHIGCSQLFCSSHVLQTTKYKVHASSVVTPVPQWRLQAGYWPSPFL
jgi:hypothetical protein